MLTNYESREEKNVIWSIWWVTFGYRPKYEMWWIQLLLIYEFYEAYWSFSWYVTERSFFSLLQSYIYVMHFVYRLTEFVHNWYDIKNKFVIYSQFSENLTPEGPRFEDFVLKDTIHKPHMPILFEKFLKNALITQPINSKSQ